MKTFETIATFTLPTDLVIAKSKLESEGIECRVLDEFTIQSDNFLSNAIGGVKLQVSQSDFDRAHLLLVNGGFIKAEKNKPSFVESKLNEPTFLKRFKIFLIALFSIFIVALIAIIVIYLMN